MKKSIFQSSLRLYYQSHFIIFKMTHKSKLTQTFHILSQILIQSYSNNRKKNFSKKLLVQSHRKIFFFDCYVDVDLSTFCCCGCNGFLSAPVVLDDGGGQFLFISFGLRSRQLSVTETKQNLIFQSLCLVPQNSIT